jgi:hypothetical protein
MKAMRLRIQQLLPWRQPAKYSHALYVSYFEASPFIPQQLSYFCQVYPNRKQAGQMFFAQKHSYGGATATGHSHGDMLRSCFDLIACTRSTFGNGCTLSRLEVLLFHFDQ